MSGRTRGLGAARGGPQVSGGQRRGALSEAARQQINQAYQQLDAKDGQAAEAFDTLAGKLAARGEALVALHLQGQAARAKGDAGDAEGALRSGHQAVIYGVQAQNRNLALRKLAELVRAFHDQGHEAAAEGLTEEIKAKLDAKRLPEIGERPQVNRAMRRTLPKRCPACGTRIAAEQVEFQEGGVAECGRCGTGLIG